MSIARSRAGQTDAEAQAACERRLWRYLTWEMEDLRAKGKDHIPFAVKSRLALQRLEDGVAAPQARPEPRRLRAVR